MAVSHDDSVSAQGSSVSTLSVSLTIANNSNRYLVAHACAGDVSVSNISTFVWNTSETLSELWNITPDPEGRLVGYGLKNPTATTANVAVTFTSTEAEAFVSGHSFYGVDQTTPVGTGLTNGATTGNAPHVATDGGQTGGIVIGAGNRYTNAAGGTLASGDGIPKFVASGALSTATGQTSRTPALPAGTLRGDVILAHCASENNATHSCATSGWNKLGQTNSGASWTVSHWWAIQTAAGLAAPVITWTGSADANARTHALTDNKPSGTPCAYIGTVGAGTASPHTSTGGNTTGDDSRVCYIDHANANTALATPSGWTEHTDSGSATGPCRTTFGGKDVATGGTGSGNISVSGAAAAWVQQQIEVLNADVGDQTTLETQDHAGGNYFIVGYEPADTAFNTIYFLNTTGTTSYQMAGAVPLNPSTPKSTPPFSRPPRFLPRMSA